MKRNNEGGSFFVKEALEKTEAEKMRVETFGEIMLRLALTDIIGYFRTTRCKPLSSATAPAECRDSKE